jgi:predicted AAA+ superfamily ATPase
MLHRLLTLPSKRSCLLFGPRQTGKSTLVRSLLPRASWTVDLLRPDVALRFAKDPAQFGREVEQRITAGVKTIFVDEVQRVPELLNEVHRLVEAHGARFLLTGSSARKLKRGGANLLAGRAATRRLHPLTTAEMGDRFDLDRTLRLGSLPAVVTGDEDDARELLRAYGETYLHEEIQAESIVRNLGGFARFLDVAAAQCGDILSYSSVGRDAGLATRTVQEYFQILEDTLIGFRLPAWRSSPRARLTAHPRFYLFDTGVTNALNRRLVKELDPRSRGRLFEQLVVLETMRLLDYAGSEARLHYWRTHVGAEVDLVVERHGELRLAVEIKSGTKVVGAELTGMRSFHEAHPEVPCVVVASVPEPYRLGDVEVLPYARYVDEIVDRVDA